MPGFTSVVVKTGSFTSVVVVVVVTVSVTLPSELVVVDDVDFVSTVVPMDSIFAEVFPSAAIGADVVVPFGATVVAVEVPVDSVVAVPVDSVEPAPVAVPVDSVVVAPVDSVVVAPSLEDALVEAPLSVAEAVVPSVEDDAAPEALDSLEVPSEEEALPDSLEVLSEEDALLPDSLEVPSEEDALLPDSVEVPSDEETPLPDSVATPVFSFVPSARAVIGDAMTAALKVAAAIPISFE